MRSIAPKLVILSVLALLLACHSPQTPLVNPTHTSPATTETIAAKPATFKKGDVDTSLYAELPYWDTSLSYSSSAYMDTFAIGKTGFRIIHAAYKSSLIVEKEDNSNWIVQYDAGDFEYSENFDRTKDLNRDGYKDLIFESRRFGSVYFFDAARKTFSDTPNCDIVTMDWLIDTARNWYAEVYPKKPVVSNLFTFKDLGRVDLLRMEFDTDNGLNLLNCLLFNANSNQTIKKLNLTGNADVWSFNYDSCWKKQFKYLHGFK